VNSHGNTLRRPSEKLQDVSDHHQRKLSRKKIPVVEEYSRIAQIQHRVVVLRGDDDSETMAGRPSSRLTECGPLAPPGRCLCAFLIAVLGTILLLTGMVFPNDSMPSGIRVAAIYRL
jgi:hypothetical protein